MVAHLLAVVQESVPLVVSRQVLEHFVKTVPSLAQDSFVTVAEHALKALQSRTISFEEHFSTMAENLASVYEKDGKNRQAAELLASIPLDSGQR